MASYGYFKYVGGDCCTTAESPASDHCVESLDIIPSFMSALRYGYAVLIRTERYRPWLIISEIVSHGLEGTIFTDQHFYFHLENMWVINLIKN